MGMMSEADMAALQNAQGAEASRLLTQMIEHHKGSAIMMAQQEVDNGQFPAAVEMAQHRVFSASGDRHDAGNVGQVARRGTRQRRAESAVAGW